MNLMQTSTLRLLSLCAVMISFQSCGQLSNDDDAYENMCGSADYAQSFRTVYESNDEKSRGGVSELSAAKSSLASCKTLLTAKPENGNCNVEVRIQGKRSLVSIAGSAPYETDQFMRSLCNDWIALVEESERD